MMALVVCYAKVVAEHDWSYATVLAEHDDIGRMLRWWQSMMALVVCHGGGRA